MSPSTASTQEASEHTDARIARVSRIPSRPASRRVNSERVATSFSVSATGSPIASTTPLPATRKVPAMTTASRIPTAFRTPTSTPTYSGARPRSFVSRRSAQSSLPRAPSSRVMPTLEARPSSVSNRHIHYKSVLSFQAPHTHDGALSRNKPLPSPPIAQVIDPNSPPRAQRTLVDAEAGILPADVWPILTPADTSSPSAALTTNVTAQQTQQPSRRDSNHSDPEEIVETFVIPRAQDNLPDNIDRPGTTTNNQEAPEQHTSGTIEQRRFSSNNPYVREFHAVSPQADVAVSSPLNDTAGSPMLLSIPPRVSSKRVSLPSDRPLACSLVS